MAQAWSYGLPHHKFPISILCEDTLNALSHYIYHATDHMETCIEYQGMLNCSRINQCQVANFNQGFILITHSISSTSELTGTNHILDIPICCHADVAIESRIAVNTRYSTTKGCLAFMSSQLRISATRFACPWPCHLSFCPSFRLIQVPFPLFLLHPESLVSSSSKASSTSAAAIPLRRWWLLCPLLLPSIAEIHLPSIFPSPLCCPLSVSLFFPSLPTASTPSISAQIVHATRLYDVTLLPFS